MDIILFPVETLMWTLPASMVAGYGYFAEANKEYVNNEPDNFDDYSDRIPEKKAEVHYDISYFEKKIAEQLKAKENKGE